MIEARNKLEKALRVIEKSKQKFGRVLAKKESNN